MIVKSGESTTTEGLGGYIWQGIATSASASKTESVSGSSKTSGSIMTSGSGSLSSATTTSRLAGTSTSGESAAATTSASQAGHMEVGMMIWLSILICLVSAVLFM